MQTLGKAIKLRRPVSVFARAMERKLRKHDDKRGRTGWRSDNCYDGFLLDRLKEEVKELFKADRNYWRGPVYEGPRGLKKVMNEAVDVANFAMMIFDRMRIRLRRRT